MRPFKNKSFKFTVSKFQRSMIVPSIFSRISTVLSHICTTEGWVKEFRVGAQEIKLEQFIMGWVELKGLLRVGVAGA